MTVDISYLAFWSMKSDMQKTLKAGRHTFSTLTALLDEWGAIIYLTHTFSLLRLLNDSIMCNAFSELKGKITLF